MPWKICLYLPEQMNLDMQRGSWLSNNLNTIHSMNYKYGSHFDGVDIGRFYPNPSGIFGAGVASEQLWRIWVNDPY